MPRRIQFLLLLPILLFLVSCSLLQGPQQLTIPTPPGGTPFASIAQAGPLITDPEGNVIEGVNPDLRSLLDQVSNQNLVGYVQTLQGFNTRNTYSVTDQEGLGIGAARRWIFNEFIRVGNGRLLVEVDEFPVNQGGVVYNQQNIVATLQGTGTHPGVIVIAAHYDSRSIDPLNGNSFAPGANDNGSGVAALLETARVLSSREWNQTIIFVAFAGEEQNRLGSTHFVTERLLQGWRFDGMMSLDIVGGRPGIPQSVRLFSPGPDGSPPRQFARYMNFVGTLYLPEFPYTLIDAEDRDGRYSDHISFLQAGISAVRVTESQEDPNRQHNSGDTAEWIDYSYLRQVTQNTIALVGNAAGGPAQPVAPSLSPMTEPGAYILTWIPDSNAAGYAISFRPVGAAEYPEFRYVNAGEAGNVAITGLDPAVQYAVSIAGLDGNGRIGLFSTEVLTP
ncbi:MAG: M20/M25/M40 family metallo-hydrolase [Anaerolineales bacterium]|nr:M20/M25/M40 family metallo-hydrolase [Anaerolineales bacterium]MCB8938149.1 M20/M25/M40 family metallo-hydrolase [Ardenticatenaceae bacterium]